ncbi:hypothetical protein Vafri_10492, partial [Volvox africanus]
MPKTVRGNNESAKEKTRGLFFHFPERLRKPRSTPMSRSARAGLIFPVAQIARKLKAANSVKRLGATAPVYLAAVLEYCAAEVLDLAASAAKQCQRSRIQPRHVMLAVKGDAELDKLLAGTIFPGAGVQPHTIPVLLKTMKTATTVVDIDCEIDVYSHGSSCGGGGSGSDDSGTKGR